MTLVETPDAPPETTDLEALIDAAAGRIAGTLSAGRAAPDGQLAVKMAAGLTDLLAPMQATAAEQRAALKTLEGTVRDMAAASAQPVPAPARPTAGGDPREILGVTAHEHSPQAMGAALDGQFASWGDFVTAAYRGSDPRVKRIPTSGQVNAVLEGEELPGGGALVPEAFRAALLRMALMPTSIRSRATVLPLSTATLDVPYLRDTTHADGQIYGGIHTYWLEAGETFTATDPEFAQVHLVVKNLVAGCVIRNTMLADSFQSVPALLAMLYPEALRRAEERSFLRGDGAGRPLGIFNSDAMISLSRNSGDNNVDAEDIHAMEGRLLPGSEMRAVWMIHPGLRKDLGSLNLGGVQYWQEDLSRPRPMTLNGRPIVMSEFCSAPGQAGDILLVDWMYYLIADRQAMSMAMSAHEKFSELATVFRFNERLDAQPWIDSPLTLEHGGASNTVSPFVRLQDA